MNGSPDSAFCRGVESESIERSHGGGFHDRKAQKKKNNERKRFFQKVVACSGWHNETRGSRKHFVGIGHPEADSAANSISTSQNKGEQDHEDDPAAWLRCADQESFFLLNR
jgi:hypothetical protein